MNRTLRMLPLVAAAALLASPSPARPQADPPALATKRPIVVGADRDYPPYEFLDRSGQPAGFNVDLTRAIADLMGMTVEFRFGPWSEMRTALASFQERTGIRVQR